MKELSLNILDIAENSVKAGATLITVSLTQAGNVLTIEITDDGCGMDAETVRRVTDPFYTTRTTRRVGLGLPLLKLEAEQTGGTLTVTSRTAAQCPENHGTTVRATFHTDHIDCMPLGDVTATLVTLIQGHPQEELAFSHRTDAGTVTLDTRQLREVLGDVPLDTYEVLKWIEGYLREQYQSINQ
ncbi:MAG: ATP-binding protein [Clostridia bacterium]|mgnify:FL=1|nr:MAG: ATP-binding protein [Clostridia bacterium]